MTVKELKVDAGGQSDEGQQNPAAISRSPLFYRQSELQGRFFCSIERAVDYEGKVRPRPAKGRMPLALSLTTRRCWLGRGSLRTTSLLVPFRGAGGLNLAGSPAYGGFFWHPSGVG